MKTKFFILWFLIFTMTTFCFVPAVIAGRGCNDPFEAYPSNQIWVDKTAPGTKYNATLTIYYADGVSCAMTSDNLKSMYFFLRMEGNVLQAAHDYSGTEYLSFGGVGECIPYQQGSGYTSTEAYIVQQSAIHDFFELEVIPFIYGCNAASTCPSYAVKSFDKIVEDDPSGDPLFMMLDLVIAVDD